MKAAKIFVTRKKFCGRKAGVYKGVSVPEKHVVDETQLYKLGFTVKEALRLDIVRTPVPPEHHHKDGLPFFKLPNKKKKSKSKSEAIDFSKSMVRNCVLEQKYKDILANPNLLNLLLKEIAKKVIGEKDTCRAVLLHMAGIWVANAHITSCLFVNSDSSAGKSWVTQQVFRLLPEQNRVYKTKMSSEAFTYWKQKETKEGAWSWDGKILYLNDPSPSLLYSDTFKVMISEGSSAVIVKNQTAIEIDIVGKPIVVLTTASGEPNAEVANRFNFVNLNESKAQTIDVMRFQAQQISAGVKIEYDVDVVTALTFLRRRTVSVPFAEDIASCFPASTLTSRRYFSRFLSLIQASASLHQFQRAVNDGGALIAEGQDYEIARAVLKKIATSENVFSMTFKLKKVLETCQALTESQSEFTVADVLSKCPIIHTDKTVRKYLAKLQEVDLLNCRQDDTTAKHRPAMLYSAKKSIAIELPPYETLVGERK